LRLRYDDDWRTAREAFPLSLSMPLVVAEHGHEPIEAFLWGLLPDNELVLDRWARRFQVSARNAFALISHVGEDCAGAVQFVRPERLSQLLTPRAPGPRNSGHCAEAGSAGAERSRPAQSRDAATKRCRCMGKR